VVERAVVEVGQVLVLGLVGVEEVVPERLLLAPAELTPVGLAIVGLDAPIEVAHIGSEDRLSAGQAERQHERDPYAHEAPPPEDGAAQICSLTGSHESRTHRGVLLLHGGEQEPVAALRGTLPAGPARVPPWSRKPGALRRTATRTSTAP
jgi:hypothetical protein